MEKLNFSINDILKKEFKTKVRGFDPTEVDAFLDDIMKDYETYDSELERLQEENQRLFAKVDELTKQVNVSRNIEKTQTANTTVTNFDILKRLSNLEKIVYNSKLEDQAKSDDNL